MKATFLCTRKEYKREKYLYIVRKMNMRSIMIGKIQVVGKSFKYARRKYTNDKKKIDFFYILNLFTYS